MSVTVKTAAIAAALGVSRGEALKRAKKEGWHSVRLPGGLRWVEYRLPMDVRLALEHPGPRQEEPGPGGRGVCPRHRKRTRGGNVPGHPYHRMETERPPQGRFYRRL